MSGERDSRKVGEVESASVEGSEPGRAEEEAETEPRMSSRFVDGAALPLEVVASASTGWEERSRCWASETLLLPAGEGSDVGCPDACDSSCCVDADLSFSLLHLEDVAKLRWKASGDARATELEGVHADDSTACRSAGVHCLARPRNIFVAILSFVLKMKYDLLYAQTIWSVFDL